MKKILFITPYNFTRKEVGGGFAYQFANRLGKNALVDIICYQYPGEIGDSTDNTNVKILKIGKIGNIGKLLSWLQCPIYFPLFTSRYSYKMIHFIQHRVEQEKYDYLVFDYSQTFAMAKAINHPNKILITHDVIFQRYARESSRFLKWIRWSESKLITDFKKFYSFSNKDKVIIKELYGVDSEVTPVFIKESILLKCPMECGNYHVFFADWSRFDNFESLDWFITNVSHKLPHEQFKVIGGGLDKDYQQKIKNIPNVRYLGFVDDPYLIIADAKSLVTPLHTGAGIKVKCLEALACGTPVVGTEVAFEGISMEFSEYLLLASTPEQYVSELSSIHYSLEEKIQLRELFLNNYSQESVVEYILNH